MFYKNVVKLWWSVLELEKSVSSQRSSLSQQSYPTRAILGANYSVPLCQGYSVRGAPTLPKLVVRAHANEAKDEATCSRSSAEQEHCGRHASLDSLARNS